MRDAIITIIMKEFNAPYSKARSIYETIAFHEDIIEEMTEVLDKQDLNIMKSSELNVDGITAYDLMIGKIHFPVKSYYYLALLRSDKDRAIKELRKIQ